MITNKEEITFDEFKAWLTGLIVGKRGVLPDIEDWKMIKEMMNKVKPEVIAAPAPKEIPWTPPWEEHPYRPYTPDPWTQPIPPRSPYTLKDGDIGPLQWTDGTGDYVPNDHTTVSDYTINTTSDITSLDALNSAIDEMIASSTA